MGARGFCWRSAGGARPRCGVGRGGFTCCGRAGALSGSLSTPWPPLLCGGCVGVRPFRWGPSLCGGAGGCGGLFVICIVVASIFVVCARPLFLLFVLRSRVGCGGRAARGPAAVVVVGLWACFLLCGFVGRSVDALAPRADEGRCGLRYAPGSWRASFDPGVSEWGNLAWVVLGHHHLNVYRVVGGTRGSETSQYP